MSRLRWLGLLVVALLVGAVTQILGGSPVGAVNAQHDRVVGAVPGTNSPQVVDGRVYAITQVGNLTVLIGRQLQQSIRTPRRPPKTVPAVRGGPSTTPGRSNNGLHPSA